MNRLTKCRLVGYTFLTIVTLVEIVMFCTMFQPPPLLQLRRMPPIASSSLYLTSGGLNDSTATAAKDFNGHPVHSKCIFTLSDSLSANMMENSPAKFAPPIWISGIGAAPTGAYLVQSD